MQNSKEIYAIRCYKECLSLFGLAADLTIYEKPNGNKCFASLGNLYELPQGLN
jgi:hypothetical protein